MEVKEKYRYNSIDEFTDKLQSKSPVPGGGGAAALCGAIGVSLSSMVCQVTRSKPKFTGNDTEYLSKISEAEHLRDSLLDEIDSDAEAFECLMQAYRMKKDTQEQKELRDIAIQEKLIIAIEAPLNTMRSICKTIRLFDEVHGISSNDVLSDVAVGIELCKAALKSSCMNVYINAALMKDKTISKHYIDLANELVNEYSTIADRVYENVKKSILG